MVVIWIVLSILAVAANLVPTCLVDTSRPCTADYPDFAFSAWLALHGQAWTAYSMVWFQQVVMSAVPHAQHADQGYAAYFYPPTFLLLCFRSG